MKHLLVASAATFLTAQAANASSAGPPFYPPTVTPIISTGKTAGNQELSGQSTTSTGPGPISYTLQSSPTITATGVADVEYTPAPYSYAQASSSGGTAEYFGARSYLTYPVEIDAHDAATAAQISALSTAGPIGTVSANYQAGTSGDAQVTLQFATGSFQGTEGTFNTGGGAGSSYQLTCGYGFAACTSGTWTAPIYFKSANTLAQTGSPLEFLSGIQLAAYAYAGYSCANSGIVFSVGGCNGAVEGSGNATGYVDPTITLNLPGIDPSSYTLVVGNGMVANASGNGPNAPAGPPSSVPEPASWAVFIGGFGLIGGAMRRRRANVRFA